jgi:zinc transport system ATP-binding protein
MSVATTPEAREVAWERREGPTVSFEAVGLVAAGVRIVDDVTLRIAPGTVHALVGPNGAGKTSLLRCLLGLAQHTGRIEIAWAGRSAPGVVGYVPQTLDFDRTVPITAEDFLTTIGQRRPAFLGPGAGRRRRLDTALERVGLGAKRRTQLGKLSGGELKRLLLAQALAPQPGLLVLDEPMNHLDAPGVAHASELLRELRDAGATIVCSLHDLAEVRVLADAVTVMSAGRVLVSGTPAEVLTPDTIVRAFAGGAAA